MIDATRTAYDRFLTASGADVEALRASISERFRRFAEFEAAGRSALYVRLAHGVAGDRSSLDLLAGLPEVKRQPALFFGAVRYLYGTVGSWASFAGLVREHRDEIAAVMTSRRTQTNRPARCATLLPVLAGLPQPLALLEVGAAAGLCLLPDLYGYVYNEVHGVRPRGSLGPTAPTFACRANAGTPLPSEAVRVAWRAGLDVAPIDLADRDAVQWLEALIWPGQDDRLARLRAAMDVARAQPPAVARGDLRTDLATLAAQAPSAATLVVFHTAVLSYVADRADRALFAQAVADLGAVWIANEGPGVLPGTDQNVVRERTDGSFLLSADGNPIAWTDPHGASIHWR